MNFSFALTHFLDLICTESVILTKSKHDVEAEKQSTVFQAVRGNVRFSKLHNIWIADHLQQRPQWKKALPETTRYSMAISAETPPQ